MKRFSREKRIALSPWQLRQRIELEIARSQRLFPALRRFGLIDDLAKKSNVAAKGSPPNRRCLDPGLRPSPDEKLLDIDIARSGQRIDVRSEISVGRFDHGLQLGELQRLAPFQRVQDGHDPEPYALMDDVVGAHR